MTIPLKEADMIKAAAIEAIQPATTMALPKPTPVRVIAYDRGQYIGPSVSINGAYVPVKLTGNGFVIAAAAVTDAYTTDGPQPRTLDAAPKTLNAETAQNLARIAERVSSEAYQRAEAIRTGRTYRPVQGNQATPK